jgi:hypothetical protein
MDAASSSSTPVGLDATPREDASLATIVHTDNKLFNKVILIFAHLCIEAEALKTHARQHILPPLLVLNEEAAGPATRPETEGAALLPLLFEMQVFMQRANALTINLLHQLASLYESKQRLYVSTFKAVKLRRAFEALGAPPPPPLLPAPAAAGRQPDAPTHRAPLCMQASCSPSSYRSTRWSGSTRASARACARTRGCSATCAPTPPSTAPTSPRSTRWSGAWKRRSASCAPARSSPRSSRSRSTCPASCA